jgi:hypothetical protein
MYQEALALYHSLLDAAQTDNRRLNDALLHYGLKLLQHSAAAATAQTAGASSRSLRYAQMAAANLFASIDATWCSGRLSDEERQRLRHRLFMVLTVGTNRADEATPEIVDAVELPAPVVVAEDRPQPDGRGHTCQAVEETRDGERRDDLTREPALDCASLGRQEPS